SILIFALVIISCGTTVNYDYDKQTNFTNYQSYNYFPDIDSGLSELDNKRIINATDSLMVLRGFVKSETPQFLINFFAREGAMRPKNTIGIGMGGGGGNVGVGVSGGIPIGGNVIEQRLTFDFVDANKDELIWHAVSNGEIKEKASPDQKDKHYIKLINKILKGYPPKKK
ncbi:MAG: DUF4136 domain-containing protein, partial [Flavobacteriaceae bacterium]|nr:DUF4136 domain-containing protein [Flavobacteriaceae bacterium]